MNTNVHRILIPVDFSSAGESAVSHGAYLANAFRADVVLLHVMGGAMEYPKEWFSNGNSASDKGAIQPLVDKKLSEHAENLTKKYGIFVQNIIATGKPSVKIAETVVEQNIDLIVMGTHGVSGYEEFFMGSTAHKVVNLSPCPVMTIREGFQAEGIKSIVLPIDESRYSRQKVRNVLPIAAKCNATVHVLGLVTSNDKSDLAKFNVKMSSVEEAVEKAGLTCVKKVVKGNNIAIEAMKYAEEVNAEMLTIMTDHESNLTGMFMGAFARQIVNHSKIPVLSIKPMAANYEASA